MSGLFNIIRIPFAFIMKALYGWTGSYFVAILLFSVLLKVIMFPFGIKQQKNSQKQAKLRPKENVIRKKYAGRSDRATQLKMNEEIQKLYQEENFSPFGGCLPMLVQMLVLLAVYAIVRAPLTYTANIPSVGKDFDTVESIKQTVTCLVYKEDMEAENPEDRQMHRFLTMSKDKAQTYTSEEFWEAYNAGKFQTYAEVNCISYIRDNEEKFIEFYDSAKLWNKKGEPVYVGKGIDAKVLNGKAIVDALPKMEVLDDSGFDIGVVPNLDLFGAEKLGTKLLLLIPVLTLITSYFGQALTRKFTYQPQQTEELKNQNRMMNVFMPLFSFYIATQVPAAVGVYWMMSNVLSPVQQIALSKMFPIKEISPEEMKEAERLYGGKPAKKKKTPLEPGKKRKSLVYDDDDEYESVSSVSGLKKTEEKKEFSEKENAQGGMIEKAPLKDDDKK